MINGSDIQGPFFWDRVGRVSSATWPKPKQAPAPGAVKCCLLMSLSSSSPLEEEDEEEEEGERMKKKEWVLK